jgi:hypothetical protein
MRLFFLHRVYTVTVGRKISLPELLQTVQEDLRGVVMGQTWNKPQKP